MIAREYTKFISEFVCHPKSVGALAPSSVHLARHLVESIDWPNASAVLEYGPGTGSITEEILCQLPPQTTFIAIEISSRFAEMLRTRFPGLTVCEGSVGHVKEHCASYGIQQVDAIVSGLPWSSFSEDDQTAYLDATMEVLRPGGQFLNYGYFQALLLPGGRRFRRKLDTYFSEVRVSKPVWANLPPAFFYRCRR
jgi:phospholipid N-methyltransferase